MFHKGNVPFIRLLIPLIVGIIGGWFFPEPILLNFGLILLTLIFVIFIIAVKLYRQTIGYKRVHTLGIGVHLFLFLTGYILCLKTNDRYHPHYFTANVDGLVLQVTSEPTTNDTTYRFQANVIQCLKDNAFKPAKGKLLVAIKALAQSPLSPLTYGDIILIPANFKRIAPALNPGEFDFRKYAASRGIYHQVIIQQQQLVILKHASETSIIAYAFALRKKLVAKLNAFLTDKQAASLAATLLLGYRTTLSKELISIYSQTGTMHVLAVSGMHVGIVFLALSFLLRPLNKNHFLQFLRILTLVLCVWLYALITGFSPSVCRAATMLSFIVLGQTIHKNNNVYNLLAVSAFILLVYNPLYLFDVGFQLSYLAVVGLIYLHPKIYNSWYIKNKILSRIWSYSALSIAAQVVTFPISIYYFHQFPLYFLLSNLLIILPITLLMYMGLVFLLIPFSILLKPLGMLLSQIIISTNSLLRYIQQLPLASLDGVWINAWQCLLIYCCLAGFLWLGLSRSKKASFTFVGLLIVTSFTISHQIIKNQNRHELIFYSIKNSTAIGHIFQSKATLITDLQSHDSRISFSIKPAFTSKRARLERLLSLTDSIRTPTHYVFPNLMQFGNYKIAHWTPAADSLQWPKQLEVNALLLSGNPKTKLATIIGQLHFSILLISGNNTNYHIKKWQSEAKLLGLNYHILKDDGAFVVEL